MNDTTRLVGVVSAAILAACGGQARDRRAWALGLCWLRTSFRLAFPLTENRIVAGYERVFSVGTLERATRDFDGLYDVQHRFEPPGGVTLLPGPRRADVG